MTSPLLIIGASVRAAAQSALKAGFDPLAIDMFADVDLREIAQTRRSIQYPDDVLTLASEFPDAPFLYTGALENSPGILRKLQANRPLWGNGEKTLRLVRDPVWVQETLMAAGLCFVPTRRTPAVLRETERWLKKPLASAAGLGIEFDSREPRKTADYWQQYVPGIPISALYLADDRTCQLIGTARQWAGWPGFPVGPFQFCGAVVLAPISESIKADLALMGTQFAELSGMRGLFGIDLMQQDDRVFAIEINPRPTATLELYERIFDRSFLEHHTNVFRGIEVPSCPCPGEKRSAAKMILYAPQTGRTPPVEFWNDLNKGLAAPAVADLPDSEQQIEIGQPVCTILADDPTEMQVLDSLKNTAVRVAREFGWTDDFERILKGLKLN